MLATFVRRVGAVRTVRGGPIGRRMVHMPRHGTPLPEDETPAMWQRIAQLIAGSAGACTITYFLLFADFGEGEHCFRPVRCMLTRCAACCRWRDTTP